MSREAGTSSVRWWGAAAILVVGAAAVWWWVTPPSSPRGATVPPSETTVPFQLTEGPVSGFPDLRSRGDAAQHLQLHLLSPRVSLPDQPLAVTDDEFVLTHEALPNPRDAPRVLEIVRAPLPFPVDADDQLFRPQDMEVEIDGEPVEFSRRPAPKARTSTWRINGRNLVVTHPEVPAEGALTVRYPGVRQQIVRHHPEASGLTAEAFVRTEVTVGHHTRSGVLLVAPATLEWDVTIPKGTARFEGWVTMEPAPLRAPALDPADLSLQVVVDGSPTEIARIEVTRGNSSFTRWAADLSRWSGQAVTLRMRADPRRSPTYDWVFVGSPTVWGPAAGDVRRVVVIGLDTTRPDHLSFNGYRRPTTPELDAFARSAVVFDQTWAPAPRTRPSFRSATTGRRPLDAVGATNLGAVFRDQGFATAGIVANPHLQPHFDFSDGFDSWQFDGRADAAQQVDRALAWLTAHADQDSYLFLHIMDPHMIYDAPGDYRERFLDRPDPDFPARITRREVLARMADGSLTESQRSQLEALYDGELAFTSAQLGRLFDSVDRMPGRSVVVLHTDHGEEFWEHGGFEHNHTLYDEVTRAALVIRPRGGLAEGKRVDVPATLADIAPTLFDLFGVADGPPVDGRTLVPLLADADAPWSERPIPIGHLQYSHERWGVVWDHHKYILHTGSGEEELYDLGADPGERQNLADQRSLDAFRAALATSHDILVGPGWRIRVQIRGSTEPIRIDLPAEAVRAGVLDPESITEHRANIEWGGRPKRTPNDVGTVTLSSDRRQLTFTPGPTPWGGVAYVVFAQSADPHLAALSVGGAPVAPTSARRGPRFVVPGGAVILDPGTVVVPPPTEAQRMGLVPAAEADDDVQRQLCTLGYIPCDDDDADP